MGSRRRARAVIVAIAVAVALVAALLAWWLLRDGDEPPVVAPDPVPTLTPTPTPEPARGPCAQQAATGFVPTTLSIPGVVRRARVIGVPRTAAGVVGVLSHSDNVNFAWDLGGVEPGSDEGHVLLNTHTWPDGSAMGNRLLERLQVGSTLRVGDGTDVACYRVAKRVEVPAEDGYPGWADKDGPSQLVIVVCSGVRRGPGDWSHRTLWFAEPWDPAAETASPSANLTPLS